MNTMRFKIGPDGKPVFIGSSPDGEAPPPDPKTPRFTVSYEDLMEAARTGKPIVPIPAGDDGDK